MRKTAIPALVLIMAFVPAGLAAHPQDDAGTGGDAPDAWEDAITLAPGAYTGEINDDHGDQADWYRTSIPVDKYLRVSSAPSCLMRLTNDESSNGPFLYGQILFLDGSYLIDELSAVRIGMADWERFGCPSSTTYDLTLELLDLTPQDDAGTGGDASDRWEDAITVPPETHDGILRLRQVDLADLYRFEIPEGKVLRIDLETSGSQVWHNIGPDDGSWSRFKGHWLSRDGGWDITGVPAVRWGVGQRTCCGQDYLPAPYRVHVDIRDPPDVAVQAVAVGPEPALGEPRTVTVMLSNEGLGPAYETLLYVRVSHPWHEFGQERVISRTVVDELAPGEDRVLTFDWDTTGQLGRAVVEATATTWADGNPANDDASAATHVLTTAGGIDALNQRYGSNQYDGTTVGVNHDIDGSFVFARSYEAWPACVHVEAGVDRDGSPYAKTGYPWPGAYGLPRCWLPSVPP